MDWEEFLTEPNANLIIILVFCYIGAFFFISSTVGMWLVLGAALAFICWGIRINPAIPMIVCLGVAFIQGFFPSPLGTNNYMELRNESYYWLGLAPSSAVSGPHISTRLHKTPWRGSYPWLMDNKDDPRIQQFVRDNNIVWADLVAVCASNTTWRHRMLWHREAGYQDRWSEGYAMDRPKVFRQRFVDKYGLKQVYKYKDENGNPAVYILEYKEDDY